VGDSAGKGREVQRAPHTTRRNLRAPRRRRRPGHGVPQLEDVVHHELARRHSTSLCRRAPRQCSAGTLAHPPGRARSATGHHVVSQSPVRQPRASYGGHVIPDSPGSDRGGDPQWGDARGRAEARHEHSNRAWVLPTIRDGPAVVSRTSRLGEGALRRQQACRLRAPSRNHGPKLGHLSGGAHRHAQ
jgi:hypothetical protein